MERNPRHGSYLPYTGTDQVALPSGMLPMATRSRAGVLHEFMDVEATVLFSGQFLAEDPIEEVHPPPGVDLHFLPNDDSRDTFIGIPGFASL